MGITEKGDGEHHIACWTHFDVDLGRVGFVGVGCRRGDDLFCGCFDGHVEEEDDENSDDGDGDETSHGGFVVGVAVVPE